MNSKRNYYVGVLHGIKGTIKLKNNSFLNHPVPFALEDKVETLLKTQVNQVELQPVNKSEWVIPIVVVPKICIRGDFSHN